MAGTTGVRKRNKPTFVCTNCKKRKTKCDRKVPCSSCIKTNSGFTCAYESNWRPVSFSEVKKQPSRVKNSQTKGSQSPKLLTGSVSLNHSGLSSRSAFNDAKHNPFDELTVLKKKLSQLESSIRLSTFAASDGFSQPVSSEIVRLNEYPPSHQSSVSSLNDSGPIIKIDPWLRVLWKYFTSKSSSERNDLETNEIKLEIIGNSDLEKKSFQQCCSQFLASNTASFGIKSQNGVTDNVFVTGAREEVGSMALTNMMFEGRLDGDMSLNDRILQVLPRKRVLWGLIDKFFSKLYPFFPFLDEVQFKEDLSKLIGPICYEDSYLESIDVKTRTDLANMAICLILLRLGYISLLTSRNVINGASIEADNSSQNYLLASPINLVAIDVARLCLQYVQISKAPNFTVLQALFYHRIYTIHAPEEGLIIEVGDSQAPYDSLISMAYNLSLHREPDEFDNCRRNEKASHLGRKIWYYLVSLEVMHCINVGSNPRIDSGQFDVKAPFVTNKNHNSSNTQFEQQIISSFHLYRWHLSPLRNILSLVEDLNNRCSVKNLMKEMAEIETICSQFFNVLRLCPRTDIIPFDFSPEHYVDMVKAKVFLLTKLALFTLYYHLYLHYEKSSNFQLSYLYLMKIYRIIYDEFLPYIFEVFHGIYSNNGIIFNTLIQMVMHKTNQTLLSNLTRVNHLKYSMEAKPDHKTHLLNESSYRGYHKRTVRLSDNIGRTGEMFTTLFKRHSSACYYARKASKSQSDMFNILGTDELYNSPIPKLESLHIFQYSDGQLDELNNLIYTMGKRIADIVEYDQGVVDSSVKWESVPDHSSKFNDPYTALTNESLLDNVPPFVNLNLSSDTTYINHMWNQLMEVKDPVKDKEWLEVSNMAGPHTKDEALIQLSNEEIANNQQGIENAIENQNQVYVSDELEIPEYPRATNGIESRNDHQVYVADGLEIPEFPRTTNSNFNINFLHLNANDKGISQQFARATVPEPSQSQFPNSMPPAPVELYEMQQYPQGNITTVNMNYNNLNGSYDNDYYANNINNANIINYTMNNTNNPMNNTETMQNGMSPYMYDFPATLP